MERDIDKDERKKKKRVIPFLWWFGGAAVGGGLIVLAVLLANKNNQVNELEQKLGETETNFLKEKETLSNELKLTHYNFDTLKTGYDVLEADLSSARERNARLSSVNASNNQQIIKFKNDNAALQSSIDKYLSENEALNTRIGILNSQVEDLQAQLEESNTTNALQAEMINDQNERIAADSAAIAEEERLKREEDVSGYFNNTDVSAAVGLAVRSVPYSKYFYGISTINGYVINKRFLTGIGVGLNAYNGGLMAPVYLDFRYNLRESGYIPYIFADGGLLIVFDDLKEPGLFINPGTGVFRNVSDRIAVNLGAGVFIQRTPVKSSFINFKLGLIFLGKKED